MIHPILVTGAAGGMQGSTGRQVASLLMERGIPVRAFVHKLDPDPMISANKVRMWLRATS